MYEINIIYIYIKPTNAITKEYGQEFYEMQTFIYTSQALKTLKSDSVCSSGLLFNICAWLFSATY